MADTKISALTGASAAADANELPINEAGTSKKLTSLQMKTYVNTGPTIAAGTATAGTWPVHTAGTLLTSPVAGGLEVDTTNFYMSTENSNRGIVPIEYFIRTNAQRTFTSNTSQQAIFTTPTNGTLTLPVGVYEFDLLMLQLSQSITSGNGVFSIIGAGTATLTQILQFTWGMDFAQNSPSTVSGHVSQIATQNATNAIAATTAQVMILRISGTFNVSVTGTIIPSFAQTTAAAATVEVGTFFKCKRFGAQGVTSVGNWS